MSQFIPSFIWTNKSEVKMGLSVCAIEFYPLFFSHQGSAVFAMNSYHDLPFSTISQTVTRLPHLSPRLKNLTGLQLAAVIFRRFTPYPLNFDVAFDFQNGCSPEPVTFGHKLPSRGAEPVSVGHEFFSLSHMLVTLDPDHVFSAARRSFPSFQSRAPSSWSLSPSVLSLFPLAASSACFFHANFSVNFMQPPVYFSSIFSGRQKRRRCSHQRLFAVFRFGALV